jgi:hypothetical protein
MQLTDADAALTLAEDNLLRDAAPNNFKYEALIYTSI